MWVKGPSHCFGLCHKPYHKAAACAHWFYSLTHHWPLWCMVQGAARQVSTTSRAGMSQPETLERSVSPGTGVCSLFLPPHLCHMQAKGAQGERLRGDTSQLAFRDQRPSPHPKSRGGTPFKAPVPNLSTLKPVMTHIVIYPY